jgi:D-serine deaminase-like pyridoxal phosphate-dependent protein
MGSSVPTYKSAHDAYFAQWQALLQRDGDGVPSLVLDEARVRSNAEAVRSLWPARHALRLAVKSLPCVPLLRSLAAQLQTERFMVFHPAHVRPVLDAFSSSDLLFGKPVPTRAVERTLDQLKAHEINSVRWLADTPARAEELSALARARGVELRVAVEVDIGLHRGGASSSDEIQGFREAFRVGSGLRFAGLMGYDGHLGRIPWPLQRIERSHARSMQRYQEHVRAVDALGWSWEGAVRNAGGSLSFMEYREGDPTDDLTIGSALVKPAHFDDKRLASLSCALWIATPVLKRVERFDPPDTEWLAALVPLVKGLRGAGVYLFGGRFHGQAESPKGLVANLALGDSANQALYQLERSSTLAVDDWVFFRPHESEATMDTLSHVLVSDGTSPLERWPTLRV